MLGQFSDLDPKDPSVWPSLPRYALFARYRDCGRGGALVCVVEQLLKMNWNRSRQEVKLRADYKTKLTKAVNLDVLKKQREQVQQYVTQLEKQLPSKAEMDACYPISTRRVWGVVCSLICFVPDKWRSRSTTLNCPLRSKSRPLSRYWRFCLGHCQSFPHRDLEQS